MDRLLRPEDVSVVVPTFNRRDSVGRALRSVLAQTALPGQVLLVDDGSEDQTREYVSRELPEVEVVRQEHSGVSRARNLGIAEARGAWLAFLDSDDEWMPNKLGRQLDALRLQPEYLICHTDEIWIRNGRRVNPRAKHAKRGGWIFRECLPLCIVSPSSVLVHRDVLGDVGLFDESLPACEDYDLWLRICARYPVLLLDEPLIIKYGGHEDQLSRRYWGMDRFRIRALEKVLEEVELPDADRSAAREQLLEKIDIYLLGAEKRGKVDEIAEYRRKRDMYV